MLFARSIRENLQVGRPDATDAEMIDALERAQAWEFIARQPDGLDTMIGERGRSLSGGERQRLSIARALLKNPPILILDEATSALDAATERKLQARAREVMEGRTTFVIAHRLATIRNADRILVFDKGRIVETGTFDELVAARRPLCRARPGAVHGDREPRDADQRRRSRRCGSFDGEPDGFTRSRVPHSRGEAQGRPPSDDRVPSMGQRRDAARRGSGTGGWAARHPAARLSGFLVGLAPSGRPPGERRISRRGSGPARLQSQPKAVGSRPTISIRSRRNHRPRGYLWPPESHASSGTIGAASSPGGRRRVIPIGSSASRSSIPPSAIAGAYCAPKPTQLLKQQLYGFFQLPWLPEAVLRVNDFAVMRRAASPVAGPAPSRGGLRPLSESLGRARRAHRHAQLVPGPAPSAQDRATRASSCRPS